MVRKGLNGFTAGKIFLVLYRYTMIGSASARVYLHGFLYIHGFLHIEEGFLDRFAFWYYENMIHTHKEDLR